MNILDDSDYESIKEGEIYRLYTSGENSIHDKYNPYFYQLDTSNKDKNIKVLTPIKYTCIQCLYKSWVSTHPSKINIMSKSTAEKQTTLKYILLLGSQDVIFSLLKITSSHSTGSKNCMLLTDKIMTDNRKNDIFPVYTYNQECKFDFYEGAFSFQKTNQ